MPELPEVETIKRDLQQLVVGKKILDVTTDSPKQVKPSLKLVKKAIIGMAIKKVERRAKLIQIFLSNNKILIIHLKLTGRVLIRDKQDPLDKWQHVTINLNGNQELRFCDLRKFGWVKLVTNKELQIINKELGVEPFDKEFTVDYLKKLFAKTNRAIKIVIMDQKKISGIGNIYANDALFLAGINPRRPAKKLRNSEVTKLRKAIKKVLKAGIKHRGASDQHYLDALGQKGSYQDHFLTYQRDGQKCFNCQGKIKRIKLGGRSTFYCPVCQHLMP